MLTPLTAADKPVRGRRRRIDPAPRFKVSKNQQLDVVNGTPELQLADDHQARKVWRQIEKLDLGGIEGGYSSLGRRGYEPKRLLAVLIYASLKGVHHSTKVAAAVKTDAAFRWLMGGWSVSSSTLRRFRQVNEKLFADAVEQTVAIALESEQLKVDELAADSVRLRAHAGSSQVRTVKRSTERLKELDAIDISALNEEERRRHDAKVAKHKAALKQCNEEERTNIVLTSPSAGLLKFPSGASGPGHRVTVVAGGKKSRIAVAVLIDAAATDYGKLGPAVTETRRVLLDAGMREDTVLRVRADAGYWTKDDLKFASDNAAWVDALVAERVVGVQHPCSDQTKKYFGRERFKVLKQDTSAICPAGRPMRGPTIQKNGNTLWKGVGCATCHLRTNCTPGTQRILSVDFEGDELREKMQQRMLRPDAKALYAERIATIEPVFSFIEDTMGFRRVSSRLPETVRAEILLKVLAHNIARLCARSRLWTVILLLPDDA